MAYFINEKRWFFMGFLGDLMGYLWWFNQENISQDRKLIHEHVLSLPFLWYFFSRI
jgi:hypothetical protein